MTKKLDKTVYSTVNNAKAESGTAQDVLQSTPTVSVSPDGDIAIKGNHNVTVMINGKPSAVMSGENRAVALQTMSGSDIASVEVITNPSAAYNANGGAIINIVLKKNRKPGGHMAMRANASDQGLWNANLSGDYSKNKLSVHGSIGLRRDGTLKFRRSDVHWRDPSTGTFGENLSSSDVFIRRMTQNASAGLDYDLSDADSLSASATYNFRRSRPYFDELDQNYASGILTDAYHHISIGPNQQMDDSFNLSYNRQTDDTVLKAALQHGDTINLVDKSFVNAFVFPIQPPDYARVANKAGRRLDEASLDYARPMLKAGQLGLGLDFQRDANIIGNHFGSLDPGTGAETVDPAITHRYQVVVTQTAAYITGQFVWADHWEALIGARFETLSTRLDAEAVGSGLLVPTNSADYHSLNPSLHLKYTVSAHRSVTLSYRQSLQRPDPRDLNPYIAYGDAQNRYTGNPDLKPQGVKSLELTYDEDRDGFSQGLSAFYRQSRDTVVDVRTFTAGNILLTSKQNAGSGTSAGLSESIDWKASESLHLTADASLYHVILDSLDLTGPVRQSGLSYSANLSLAYSSGANDMTFDVHANGPGIVPQGKTSATSALNITWTRRLTTRLSFNLSASDVLDGAKQDYSTTTSTFVQRGYNHFVAQRVYLGLVYKIG